MDRVTSDRNDETPWHAVPADDVLQRLRSNLGTGLDSDEVVRRREQYGPNRLPEAGKRGPLMRFIAQFNNILVYVLLFAGFAKLMLGLWIDAAVILGAAVGRVGDLESTPLPQTTWLGAWLDQPSVASRCREVEREGCSVADAAARSTPAV